MPVWRIKGKSILLLGKSELRQFPLIIKKGSYFFMEKNEETDNILHLQVKGMM